MPTAGPLWQKEDAQNPEDAGKMGCKRLVLSACGVAGQLGARPCASQVPVPPRCLCSAAPALHHLLPAQPSQLRATPPAGQAPARSLEDAWEMTQDLDARAQRCVPAVSALGCLRPLGLLLPSGSWPKSASRGAWEMGGAGVQLPNWQLPPIL